MFFDFLKDIFGGPDYVLKKLTPDYFARQRIKMETPEKYVKWLLKMSTQYTAMARMERENGRPVSQSLIGILRLIDQEREKVMPQGISIFSAPIDPAIAERSHPLGMIISVMVIILVVGGLISKVLMLFGSVMSDKDRTYVESVVPVNLSSNEYRKNIGDAYNYQGKKNYTEMLKSSQKALQLAGTDKEKVESHYWVGLSFFKLGDVKNAESQYNAAISIDPDYVPALSSLSAVYYTYGKFDQAISSARKAIGIDPKYAWAYSNLALAYAGTGRLAESIEASKTAISISPKVPDFYLNLAYVYFQNNQIDEAIDQYNAVIKIDPNFEKAHFGLALAYRKKDNFEKYESELKSAIRYNAQFTDAYLSLFEYYAYANRASDLKDLIIKYLAATGKTKEILKNEINKAGWMLHKTEVLKAVDEAG